MINTNRLLLATLLCHGIAYTMHSPIMRTLGIVTTFSVGTWTNSKLVDGLDSCYYLDTAKKIKYDHNKYPLARTEALMDTIERRITDRFISHKSDTKRYQQALSILRNVYKQEATVADFFNNNKQHINQIFEQLER